MFYLSFDYDLRILFKFFELELASEHLLENSATFVEGENFEAVVAGFVAADVGRVGGFASRMCKSC